MSSSMSFSTTSWKGRWEWDHYLKDYKEVHRNTLLLDTWWQSLDVLGDIRRAYFQLLLPLLHHYHIKEILIKSIHVTDLTSSPEFLCPTVRRSRATAMAASWSTTCGSRIRDRNGGSSIADSVSCWLVMTKMADPLSCWHLMAVVVDRDRGGSSWWILVAALDSDCGLYWHPMVDHDRGGSWP